MSVTSDAIAKLRKMINVSGNGCSCFLGVELLENLLERYPCYELAAYHACIIMAQRTDMRLSDGTEMPDQSSFWLRCALAFRENKSRPLCRADEVSV